MTAEPLSVLTVNIGNPSRERAEKQLAWLRGRDEHVLVLTETADSKGCAFLAEAFDSAGFEVAFPLPERGERGVMTVSRVPSAGCPPVKVDYLPHRAVSVSVATDSGPVDVLGLYVPSRDASAPKVERKRRFLADCMSALHAADQETARVAIGDLNILEPDHQPRYSTFKPFEYDFYRQLGQAGYHDAFRLLSETHEYSWVGRTGDGYRYDHAFVSGSLKERVGTCAYVHETRTDARFTDHSGMTLTLRGIDVHPWTTGDPAAPGALF